MAFIDIPNVVVKGFSACVPPDIDENINYSLLTEEERAKVISSIGVERKRVAKDNVSASDLCYKAAEKLIEELHWDKNDIGRNLGFGNHVGCCTSIGKFNQYVAPQHLTNSFINGMEIVDDAGNSYGNSMCYFAMVDGKLHLVIDSFEVDGNLSASEDVTKAIIEYAKEVCARMGRPDAKVIFGPYFNKINSDCLCQSLNHTVEVIGQAPEPTYLDALKGACNINKEHDGLILSEIMDF